MQGLFLAVFSGELSHRCDPVCVRAVGFLKLPFLRLSHNMVLSENRGP